MTAVRSEMAASVIRYRLADASQKQRIVSGYKSLTGFAGKDFYRSL
jgi:hypothetical protein